MYKQFLLEIEGLNLRAPKIAMALAASLGLFLSACAQDLSSNTYSRGAVGTVSHMQQGTVVNARNVTIDGTKTHIGTGAGAVIGGVAGSNIGGSSEDNVIGAVAGAVLGGLAGNAIERGVTRQSGIEYTIQTQAGDMITVVQTAKSGLIYPGTPVNIVYGADRVRIVPTGYNQAYQNNSYQGGYQPYPDDPRLIR